MRWKQKPIAATYVKGLLRLVLLVQAMKEDGPAVPCYSEEQDFVTREKPISGKVSGLSECVQEHTGESSLSRTRNLNAPGVIIILHSIACAHDRYRR